VSAILVGEGFRLRRAEPEDVDFVLSLTTGADVDPFLAAVRPKDRDSLLAEIDRSLSEPQEHGRFIVEVAEADSWQPAGMMGFELASRRSRIARLGGLAVHADYRGRGLADRAARILQRYLLFELGYHRLELECYGFNERAIRHAERSGFVREGVKRKAYWRHGEWVDGVLFSLLQEDLESP
jgi:RimJ/RimL family protein N-acetyltransferase